MPQQYQQGSDVGTVVGTGGDDKGTVRDDLHPWSSEAGMALLIAVGAFAVLALTVGRSASGGKKILVVGEFVLIVLAASAVGQYAVRTFALRHPDNPVSAGISVAI